MKTIKMKPKGKYFFHTYGADFGGCGIIRTWIPSMLLTSYMYKGASFISTYNYTYIQDKQYYNNLNFVKFQRPAEDVHFKMLMDLKHRVNFKPIIVDYDDYVFSIPDTNVAEKYYTERSDIIKKCLELADGITVSTDVLRQQLLKYNPNISVVPNLIPKFLWGEPVFSNHNNKKPKILYPGSPTHFNQKGSGGDFSKEFIKFISTTCSVYEWHFIGGVPFELKNNDKIFIHSWQSYFDYPAYWKNLNIDIGIAPLEDNIFNRCKSNIKMQEYVAMGMCGIYQNLDPYSNAKVKASSTEEFISNIELYANDVDKRYDVWKTDYDTLKDDLFFEGNEMKWLNKNIKLLGREF